MKKLVNTLVNTLVVPSFFVLGYFVHPAFIWMIAILFNIVATVLLACSFWDEFWAKVVAAQEKKGGEGYFILKLMLMFAYFGAFIALDFQYTGAYLYTVSAIYSAFYAGYKNNLKKED